MERSTNLRKDGMATPKELVEKVAELTGVPEGTVIQHDRNLSVAGLRTVGGRGRAAAQVTYQDAANLLIAVAGSRNVKDSVKTVQEYAGLPGRDTFTDGNEIRGKTFGDALTALLEAIPQSRDSFTGGDDSGWVEVSLFGPNPKAVIEISKPGDATPMRFDYDQMWGARRGERKWVSVDLQFIAKFTHTTIGHVGELVAGL